MLGLGEGHPGGIHRRGQTAEAQVLLYEGLQLVQVLAGLVHLGLEQDELGLPLLHLKLPAGFQVVQGVLGGEEGRLRFHHQGLQPVQDVEVDGLAGVVVRDGVPQEVGHVVVGDFDGDLGLLDGYPCLWPPGPGSRD